MTFSAQEVTSGVTFDSETLLSHFIYFGLRGGSKGFWNHNHCGPNAFQDCCSIEHPPLALSDPGEEGGWGRNLADFFVKQICSSNQQVIKLCFPNCAFQSSTLRAWSKFTREDCAEMSSNTSAFKHVAHALTKSSFFAWAGHKSKHTVGNNLIWSKAHTFAETYMEYMTNPGHKTTCHLLGGDQLRARNHYGIIGQQPENDLAISLSCIFHTHWLTEYTIIPIIVQSDTAIML